MNLADLIILLLVGRAIWHWSHLGFSRGLLSLVGFMAGLLAGALLAALAIPLIASPTYKAIIGVIILLVVAELLGRLGSYLGSYLRARLERYQLARVDAALGGILGATVAIITIWMLAAVLAATPFMSFNRELRQSRLLSLINRTLPPAPPLLSRLGSLISPGNFPRVFVGNEPPIEPVGPPSSASVAAALAAAGRSTVRIESAGCGGQIFGSGFVSAPGTVVTNAHVVAGVRRPQIVDRAGRHPASVVYFDPDLDIAILKASDLAGPPLPLETRIFGRGTNGAVLGYPEGGPLDGEPATISGEVTAVGRNIYGQRVVRRQVYVVGTRVVSGNSGGPLVLEDGRVIGLVFARSDTDPGIGYALTSPQVSAALAAVRDQAVSTGSCVN